MSLLRLLTAGRSWVGAKPMGRYKFSDPGSMPKFGSGPNPFKTKEKEVAKDESVSGESGPEAGAAKEERGEQREVALSPEAAARQAVETAAEVERKESDELDRSERSEAPAKEEPQQKLVSPGEKSPGLISKISSLRGSLRLKLWKPRKSAPEPRPVQGELSLDNIKVVRNDLSETDLEVVPLRSSAIAKQATNSADALENRPQASPAAEQSQPKAKEQDFIEASRT
jgi:hypothetical protein